MTIELQSAGTEHIEEIASLAREIWHQHYTSIITTEQIDYMLGEMYSRPALEEQMLRKGQSFYRVLLDQHCVGFVSVSTSNNSDYFLHKFYVLNAAAGKGLGSEVFRQLLALLRPATVRLTVNRQNYKSINFYFKNGFTIEEVKDFDIGRGYFMNDFVMLYRQRG